MPIAESLLLQAGGFFDVRATLARRLHELPRTRLSAAGLAGHRTGAIEPFHQEFAPCIHRAAAKNARDQLGVYLPRQQAQKASLLMSHVKVAPNRLRT